jgi:hypothetical protein
LRYADRLASIIDHHDQELGEQIAGGIADEINAVIFHIATEIARGEQND